MRATFLLSLGLGSLLLAGCQDLEQCKDPGVVQACICGPDDTGERVCKPEQVWSSCSCGPDASVTGGMGGMGGASGGMGGMGGASGGMGGMSGGMGGMSGGMGGMSGGMGGTTGGMGGTTGGMGGGDGGMEPDAGPDGGAEGDAYAGCTTASVAADCREGSTCESSDDVLGTVLSVCAPQCVMTSDCPDPEDAAYTGEIECVSTQCRLRCSFPLVGCPTGMTCAPQNEGADEFCFAD